MVIKEGYSERLSAVFKKFDLMGGLLHSAYQTGIETENFNCCYVDDRIQNGKKIRKDLSGILDDYFKDFPNATKPLYSYK